MTRDKCEKTLIAIAPPKVMGPDAKIKTTDGGTCSCATDRCNSQTWDAVFQAGMSTTTPRSFGDTSSVSMSTTETRHIATTQNAPSATTETMPINTSRSFERSLGTTASFERYLGTTATETNAAHCVISSQSYILIHILPSIMVNVFGDGVSRAIHTIFYH